MFRPVRVSNILISDEEFRYSERRHWAYLLPWFLETLLLLGAVLLVANGLPSGIVGILLYAQAAVIAATLVVYKRWNKWGTYIGIVLLLLGAVPGFGIVTFFFLLWVLGRFLYHSAIWAFYERLFITNRRLIFASGFLDTNVAMMPLTRITDISYKRPAIADLLGYGQLQVETAGQDQALSFINFINHPNEFYDILINLSTTAVGAGPGKDIDDDDGASGGGGGSGGGARGPDADDLLAERIESDPTEEIPFEGYGRR